LIHEAIDIKKEIYLAFVLDRKSQRPALIASKHGGVEIESVSDEHMIVEVIEPKVGITDVQCKKVVKDLELSHIED